MKTLLKTSIFFVLISIFTLNISAQSRSGERKEVNSEELATRQTERMAKALNLNAEQKAEIKAIHKKYNDQMKVKQQETKDSKDSGREEMKKSRDAKDAEIKAVLTPEQYEKWKAEEKKNEPRNREKRNASQRDKKES